MTTKLSAALMALILAGCGGALDRGTTSPQGTSDDPVAAQPMQIATGDDKPWGIVGDPPHVEAARYGEVVDKVGAMVNDRTIQRQVQRRRLALVNVMWEDTGRAQGSALGPNISDLTLQVRYRRGNSRDFREALMPVIRFPNFADRTGDISSNRCFVRVGNEKGQPLRSVPLRDVLRNLRQYVSVPASLSNTQSLLAPRDTHFLASAQAVFLPIPKSGKAEFNPVIFNYQSAPGSPAVLTLLVTRQGTSVKVIENQGEDRTFGGGQELYFNNNGQRAAFTAERKSDVEQRIAAQGGPKSQDDRSALAKGADVLLLVQVPLRHRNRGRLGGPLPPPAPLAEAKSSGAGGVAMDDAEASDVEQAVLGHGPNLGPYRDGANVRLVRDPRFPVRVTVQFYKATSNGVVNEADLDKIARSIGSVYEHADFVGSLVMPENDPRRPTAWQTIPNEWFPW